MDLIKKNQKNPFLLRMMVKGDPKTTVIQDVPRSTGADGTVG